MSHRQLQGYLLKLKSRALPFGSVWNTRWFSVEAVPTSSGTEYVLCYRTLRSSLHVRGFVLLREVALVLPCTRTPPAEILLGNQSSENSKARLLRGFLKHRDLCFEIRSESRNFVLRCPNRIAFAKWVAGLQRVCALPPLGGAMWPSALGPPPRALVRRPEAADHHEELRPEPVNAAQDAAGGQDANAQGSSGQQQRADASDRMAAVTPFIPPENGDDSASVAALRAAGSPAPADKPPAMHMHRPTRTPADIDPETALNLRDELVIDRTVPYLDSPQARIVHNLEEEDEEEESDEESSDGDTAAQLPRVRFADNETGPHARSATLAAPVREMMEGGEGGAAVPAGPAAAAADDDTAGVDVPRGRHRRKLHSLPASMLAGLRAALGAPWRSRDAGAREQPEGDGERGGMTAEQRRFAAMSEQHIAAAETSSPQPRSNGSARFRWEEADDEGAAARV